MLDRVISQASAWRRRGHPLLVSLALAAEDLNDPDLAVRVQLILFKWLVPPPMLELRLPPDLAAASDGNARAQLRRLVGAGVRLAADHRLGDPIAPLLRLRIGAVRLALGRTQGRDLSREVLEDALLTLRDELGWTLVAIGAAPRRRDLAALCDEELAAPIDLAAFEAWLGSAIAPGMKKAAA